MLHPVQVNIAVKITSGNKEYSIDEFSTEIDSLKAKIESLGNSFGLVGFTNIQSVQGGTGWSAENKLQ